jgi:RimJ/RimL family protein N-acetyltransferase
LIAAPHDLVTARLRLRRPRLSDAEAVFAYASDRDVARFTDWPLATDVRDTISATERALADWESGSHFGWRVTIVPDDTPIGAVGCSVEDARAEFGFVIARQHWGHGYATEAGGAVLDWLKSLDGIRRIEATCDFENAASVRVLEKLGLSRQARLPQYAVRPNMPGAPRRDAFLYSWVRST